MNNVYIESMTLENFKCHKHLSLTFDGRNASIYGDNATGKSSIYDALTWLLFGKDSMGNGEKNFEVKPLNEAGEVENHEAITSVAVSLNVSGTPITLRRDQKEVWSTKRGSSEASYTGNISEYFVDGVPMKKNLFDSKVKDLLPEATFRMLTSVSYFVSTMKWQDRRAVLMDMAGTLSDREIMEKDPKYAPLLEGMGNREMQDYKAALSYERKGLNGTRDEIPARISEAQRMLEDAKGINVADREALAGIYWNTIQDRNRDLAALDHDTVIDAKKMQSRELHVQLQSLQNENVAYRNSQPDNAGQLKILRANAEMELRRRSQLAESLDRDNAQIRSLTAEYKRLQDEWVQVNGTAFAGGICPTCGQELPFEMLQEKAAEFGEKKQARLDDLAKRGTNCKDLLAQAKASAEQTQTMIDASTAAVSLIDSQIKALPEDTKTDMPGYGEKVAELYKKIADIDAEISALQTNTHVQRKKLVADQIEAEEKMKAIQVQIAKAQTAADLEKRIAELQEQAKATTEKLDSIDQMIFLMEEFIRFKAGFVENSINGMFHLTKFQLFRVQANGGLEERCDATFDGVPYGNLNNGMKINVGIDVINALSQHYGVTVPLFIDNAEAVTKLEPCNAQTIRLVVSEEDKELRLHNED